MKCAILLARAGTGAARHRSVAEGGHKMLKLLDNFAAWVVFAVAVLAGAGSS